MKFLCEGCERLVELERYRLDEGVLVVRCDRCGRETRAVARPAPAPAPPPPARPSSPSPQVIPLRPAADVVQAAAEASEGDPLRVPEGHCPKCVARRPPGAAACPQCGLSSASFSPEALRPGPELESEWRALLKHWSAIDQHDRLLSAAVTRGELAAVGRLYRIRLAVHPEDPVAQRGRDEVLRLAALPAAAPAVAVEPGRRSGWRPLLWVLFVAASALFVIFAFRLVLSEVR